MTKIAVGPIPMRVADQDRRVFEVVTTDILDASTGPEDTADRIMGLLEALDASGLPDAVKAERAEHVLQRTSLPSGTADVLARRARRFGHGVRNAVAKYLPAEARRIVWLEEPVPAPREGSMGSAQESPTPCSARAPHREAGRPVVALVGKAQECGALIGALESEGFIPRVLARGSELGELPSPAQVVGIIIAASHWTGQAVEDERALSDLFAFSSVAWMKIDPSTMAPEARRRLPDLAREARVHDPSAWELSVAATPTLAPTDIASLKEARALLFPSDLSFMPRDLSKQELALIAAAVAKHVRGRNLGRPPGVRHLRTGSLSGGRSSARLVLLEPDDGGATIVAKVDVAERIRDEARRFSRFVAKWDTALNPKAHFHGNVGLLLFHLVDDQTMPTRPAPTLEECLAKLAHTESWGDDPAPPVPEGELARALDGAVDKLARLAKVPCRSDMEPSFAWLGTGALDGQLSRGVAWSVPCDDASGDALPAREAATRLCARLEKVATVHGDVHLRNALVRGGEVHFIDYAYAGPGHPCFDLVRLESAILFGAVRMVADEQDLARLVAVIAVEGATYADVERRHPAWVSSAPNRLALGTAVRCRAAALDVLAGYGGTLDDYLAVRYVVALQSLALPGHSALAARAVLRAIAGYVHRAAASVQPAPS